MLTVEKFPAIKRISDAWKCISEHDFQLFHHIEVQDREEDNSTMVL